MANIHRLIIIIFLASFLSACFYWIRAYQTYLQIKEFDENFTVDSDETFRINFLQPRLYDEDFIALAKLHPSEGNTTTPNWFYRFKQIDENHLAVEPETSFFFQLKFNKNRQLKQWIFSPLFLQIAPAEFLEVSFRSLGNGQINQQKRQLKANLAEIEKIDSALPKKQAIISQLGPAIEIKEKDNLEIYSYWFKLQSPKVEAGYEERLLSKIELSFDLETEELVKMSGRFVGVKISIRYKTMKKS